MKKNPDKHKIIYPPKIEAKLDQILILAYEYNKLLKLAYKNKKQNILRYYWTFIKFINDEFYNHHTMFFNLKENVYGNFLNDYFEDFDPNDRVLSSIKELINNVSVGLEYNLRYARRIPVAFKDKDLEFFEKIVDLLEINLIEFKKDLKLLK